MISPAGNFKFYVASKPVDFRKGMDGFAAIVQNEFDLDPFSGATFIFRPKRADQLKLIVWDGTSLVMTYKSASHMDGALLENMSRVVKPDDDLWVIGDFAVGAPAKDAAYLQ